MDYPVEALRLEDSSAHSTGALVPGGVIGLWNIGGMTGLDYANPSGTVGFATSGSSEWPGSTGGGEVAVLQFRVSLLLDEFHQKVLRGTVPLLALLGFLLGGTCS